MIEAILTKIRSVRKRTWVIIILVYLGIMVLGSIVGPTEKQQKEARWNQFVEDYELQGFVKEFDFRSKRPSED